MFTVFLPGYEAGCEPYLKIQCIRLTDRTLALEHAVLCGETLHAALAAGATDSSRVDRALAMLDSALTASMDIELSDGVTRKSAVACLGQVT